jgi:hypothetical protein
MKPNIVILRVISPGHRECMNGESDLVLTRDMHAVGTRLMYFDGKLDESANQILFPCQK